MNDMVSVITPAYNSSKYIDAAIESVINQTYSNWEMLIIDDASSDDTCAIVESYIAKDSRIRLFRCETNAGAAKARNIGLENALGRFIAYLDADDIWNKDKLEKQIRFMTEKAYAFSCTSYEVIDDNGNALHKSIHMLEKADYKKFLMNNLLQTVGIMVDISIADKSLLIMPDIRRRQDAATWLQVLKAGYPCYGMNEVLAKYRRANNSLSSNKFKAAKGVWKLYREVEHLPFFFSCYCYVRYILFAVWKRIYH